jgi:tetratricopeptide (TPR) repeat protein
MENNEKIKSLYEEGCKLAERDQADSAIAVFNEILSLDSGFYRAYFQRAHLYMALGEIDKAISDFSEGLGIKQDARAYLLRAAAYDTKEMFDKSSRDYSEVIELESNPAILYFAYLNRGSAFNYLNRYSEAVEDFKNAIKTNPEDPQAYKGRAVAYFHLKQIEDSISDWSTIVKLTPGDAEAYKRRASLYIQIAKIEETISDCDKSLDLDPKDSETFIIRGNAYFDRGDVQKAISDLQEAKLLGNEVAVQTLKQIEDRILKNLFKLNEIEPFIIHAADDKEAKSFFNQLTGNETFTLETSSKPLSMIIFNLRNNLPQHSIANGLLLPISIDDALEKTQDNEKMGEFLSKYAIAAIKVEIGGDLKEAKITVQKDWKSIYEQNQMPSSSGEKVPQTSISKKKGCLTSIIMILSIIISVIAYII